MKTRSILNSIKAYVPGKPTENRSLIKLNANECPHLIPQNIYKKISEIRYIERYHEASGYELRDKLAQLFNLNVDSFILGNGSGELIKTFLEAFCEKDQEVIMSDTTFSLYSLYSLIHESAIKTISLNSDFQLDLSAMLAAINEKTAAVFICNPNNPTAHAYSYSVLEEFFDKVPDNVGIFLDEAYIHYSPFKNEEKIKDMILKYPNLFILRTFSKLGLAGARIGFGMGDKALINPMNKVRSPFNTNIYAQKAASALLDESDFLSYIQTKNEEQRDFLKSELNKLGIKTYPSFASFFLIKANAELGDLLEEKGILVRKAQSFNLPADYYRITIGTSDENQKLIEVLREVL